LDRSRWNTRLGTRDHALVFTDFDPKLDRSPIGIRAGVLIIAFATPRHRVELAWRQRLVQG
jgi:hypothetical protein